MIIEPLCMQCTHRADEHDEYDGCRECDCSNSEAKVLRVALNDWQQDYRALEDDYFKLRGE